MPEETKDEQNADQLEEFSLEDYMQDDEIPSYRLNAQNYSMETIKLEMKYYKKFKKILPAGKAARFFQAENKMEIKR